jgi:hypothetical protein
VDLAQSDPLDTSAGYVPKGCSDESFQDVVIPFGELIEELTIVVLEKPAHALTVPQLLGPFIWHGSVRK